MSYLIDQGDGTAKIKPSTGTLIAVEPNRYVIYYGKQALTINLIKSPYRWLDWEGVAREIIKQAYIKLKIRIDFSKIKQSSESSNVYELELMPEGADETAWNKTYLVG